MNINSGANTAVIASNINATNDVNINAGGVAYLGAAKNIDYKNDSKSSTSLMWQSQPGSGHNNETVVATKINAGGDVNINAAKGVVVDIKNLTGNVQQDIATLSKQPGLEYLATLQNNPNVNFNLVNEASNSWDYKSQGLTQAGAAVVAIAVAAATAGAGASLAGAATGTTVTGASAGAANAAFTSLASQATISMANNQGNLGAVFKELGSSETVKSLAFAAVTAGATAGAGSQFGLTGNELSTTQEAAKIGVNSVVGAGVHSAIYGSNFSEGLLDRLKNGAVYAAVDVGAGNIGEAYHFGDIGASTQLALHGALGCAAGAALTGNCGSGAAGQVAGELASEFYTKSGGKSIQTSLDIAQIGGAVSSLVAGGDAKDIYAGSNLGHSAAENNNLLIAAAVAGGLTVYGNGNIVKGTERIGIVVNQGKEYIYRKMEDGVYAVYEMSPDAVSAFGNGLDIPANGLRYVGNAISQGSDYITGQPNSLQVISSTVGNFLNSVGLNNNFLTGAGVLAGWLGAASALEGNLVKGDALKKDFSLDKVSPPSGINYNGTVYRYENPDLIDTTWDIHNGNINANHRYSGPGEGAVYGATSQSTALSEVQYYGVDSGRIVAQQDLNLQNVLDLTNSNTRDQLGLSLKQITGDSYQYTQQIGSWARQNGYDGILAPSARNTNGSNIIILGK